MNNKTIELGKLTTDAALYDFVNSTVLPQTGLQQSAFWKGVEQIFSQFIPRNQALLKVREDLQQKIDDYHVANPNFNFEFRRLRL